MNGWATLLVFLQLSRAAFGQDYGLSPCQLCGVPSLEGSAGTLWTNPASLASAKGHSFAFIRENRMAMPWFDRTAAGVVSRWHETGIGVSALYSGSPTFSTSFAGLSVGHSLGITSVGLRAKILQYAADGFGFNRYLLIDLGGITKLGSRFQVEARVNNVNQPSYYSATFEPIMAFYLLGIHLKFDEYTRGVMQLSQEKATRLHLGIERRFNSWLAMRLAVKHRPMGFSGGLVLNKGKIRFEVCTQWQPQLPPVITGSLLYS